jgi:hypothetical protein
MFFIVLLKWMFGVICKHCVDHHCWQWTFRDQDVRRQTYRQSCNRYNNYSFTIDFLQIPDFILKLYGFQYLQSMNKLYSTLLICPFRWTDIIFPRRKGNNAYKKTYNFRIKSEVVTILKNQNFAWNEIFCPLVPLLLGNNSYATCKSV